MNEAASMPSWLRRGRTPDGQLMSPQQRRLLRVMLQLADSDGWVCKSAEYLAHLVHEHKNSVPRQLRRFAEWGIVTPEPRRIAGRLRRGWRIVVERLRPVPREKQVDLAEFGRMRRYIRELESQVAALQRVTAAAASTSHVVLVTEADEVARRFAERLSTMRVHFLELVDGARVYGEPEALRASGVPGAVDSEPLWPVEAPHGVIVPLGKNRSTLRSLSGLLARTSEDEVIETLRWYRAETHDEPGQWKWWGPHTCYPTVWIDAVRRAHAAQARHARRLEALQRRQSGPEHTVLLTSEPDTAMSTEEAEQRRSHLEMIEKWRRSGA